MHFFSHIRICTFTHALLICIQMPALPHTPSVAYPSPAWPTLLAKMNPDFKCRYGHPNNDVDIHCGNLSEPCAACMPSLPLLCHNSSALRHVCSAALKTSVVLNHTLSHLLTRRTGIDCSEVLSTHLLLAGPPSWTTEGKRCFSTPSFVLFLLLRSVILRLSSLAAVQSRSVFWAMAASPLGCCSRAFSGHVTESRSHRKKASDEPAWSHEQQNLAASDRDGQEQASVMLCVYVCVLATRVKNCLLACRSCACVHVCGRVCVDIHEQRPMCVHAVGQCVRGCGLHTSGHRMDRSQPNGSDSNSSIKHSLPLRGCLRKQDRENRERHRTPK